MKSHRSKPEEVPAGPGAPKSKADHAYAMIRQRILDGGSAARRPARHRAPGARDQRQRGTGARSHQAARGRGLRHVHPQRRGHGDEHRPRPLPGDGRGARRARRAWRSGWPRRTSRRPTSRRPGRSTRTCGAASTSSIPLRFTQTNQQFHRTLYERCPNRHILEHGRQGVGAASRRHGDLPSRSSPSGRSAASSEHEQLLQLIETGAPGEEIEAFARRHRMRTARSLLQHIGDELSDEMDAAETLP